jgi:phytoene synthase
VALSTLDADYINRAAPPGSMRYFALLYTPQSERDLLAALFVVDSEIRASATQTAHEVAHTRMQWWRAEVDRLINRNAQHPATKIIQSARPEADYALLHELLAAADMDLTRMTYHTSKELDAYMERSGGIALDLFAASANQAMRSAVRTLGKLIRRIETIRDTALEARAGRVYWPLDDLDARKISLDELKATTATNAVRDLIAEEAVRINQELRLTLASLDRSGLRNVAVLATLHDALLRRIGRADHDVFTQRHELSPFNKVWTAWRTARGR